MTDTGSYADTGDMYMVHTTFRREFGALPSLVRNVQAGDIQRSQTIGDHIDILGIYLYAHHHSEDIHLWPKLLDRGPREVAPIVHLMESQHENIERLNAEQMRRLTRGVQTPAPESREALADVLDQLIHHELIQKTLSELPPEVRTVLQEQGPRAFSSHSERVYGTATPHRSGAVMRSLRDHGRSFAEHSPRTRNAPNTEPGPRTFPA